MYAHRGWKDGKLKSTTFYHVTEDEEVFFGFASKNKREMTSARVK
jgi:Holliday junction resolvasome RuvABC DNA-binding subunit